MEQTWTVGCRHPCTRKCIAGLRCMCPSLCCCTSNLPRHHILHNQKLRTNNLYGRVKKKVVSKVKNWGVWTLFPHSIPNQLNHWYTYARSLPVERWKACKFTKPEPGNDFRNMRETKLSDLTSCHVYPSCQYSFNWKLLVAFDGASAAKTGVRNGSTQQSWSSSPAPRQPGTSS